MTPTQLKKDIEEHFKIKALETKDRTRPLPQLRYLFFKLAQEYNRDMSLREIGTYVNRDHATVIWGLSLFHQEMKYHPKIHDYYLTRYKSGIVKDVNLVKGRIYA